MTIREKVEEMIEGAKHYDLGKDYLAIIPGIVGGRGIIVEVQEILDDGIMSNGIAIPFVFGIAPLDDNAANDIRAQHSGITLEKTMPPAVEKIIKP